MPERALSQEIVIRPLGDVEPTDTTTIVTAPPATDAKGLYVLIGITIGLTIGAVGLYLMTEPR